MRERTFYSRTTFSLTLSVTFWIGRVGGLARWTRLGQCQSPGLCDSAVGIGGLVQVDLLTSRAADSGTRSRQVTRPPTRRRPLNEKCH